jgi:anti-anti-sigma regulatory factor
MTISSQESIPLKESISPNLFLREYADELFDSFNYIKNTSIIIDFAGIQSMSRSFAQEFLYRLEKSNNIITIVNEPENVKKLFDIVRKPKRKIVFSNSSSKIVSL